MSRGLDGSSSEPSYGTFASDVRSIVYSHHSFSLTTDQTVGVAAMVSDDTKRPDARSGSLDSDGIHGQDILKGNVIVGTIAGEEVRLATEQEHALSFRDAVRLYPAAIGWSMFFSLGIIMTGKDFPLYRWASD